MLRAYIYQPRSNTLSIFLTAPHEFLLIYTILTPSHLLTSPRNFTAVANSTSIIHPYFPFKMKIFALTTLLAAVSALPFNSTESDLAPRAETWGINKFEIEIFRQASQASLTVKIETNFLPGTETFIGSGFDFIGGKTFTSTKTGAKYQMWCDGNKKGKSGMNECADLRWLCVDYKGKRCAFMWLNAYSEPECAAPGRTKNSPTNCKASTTAWNMPQILKYQG